MPPTHTGRLLQTAASEMTPLVIGRFDWPRLLTRGGFRERSGLFSMLPAGGGIGGGGGGGRGRPDEPSGTLPLPPPPARRTQAARHTLASVLDALQGMATALVGAPVPPAAPLMEAGLDSLAAVELRNGVAVRFGAHLPATAALDYPTLTAMAEAVLRMAGGGEGGGGEGGEGEGMAGATAQACADMPTLPPTALPSPPTANRHTMTAILSVASRYPAVSGAGANGPSARVAGFWRGLTSGRDAAAPVPPDRWDADAAYAPVALPHRSYARLGAFVQDVASFDAAALGMAPADAASLDPQARLLLECVGDAVGDAGAVLVPALPTAGVYAGCMYSEYLDAVLAPAVRACVCWVVLGLKGLRVRVRGGDMLGRRCRGHAWPQPNPRLPIDKSKGVADSAASAITGHGLSFLVGRVAYTFGLGGPCVATDTACSSSLVASHLAHMVPHHVGLEREGRGWHDVPTEAVTQIDHPPPPTPLPTTHPFS